MSDFDGSCRLRHSKDSGHGTLHDAIGAESPKSKATEVLFAVCDRQTDNFQHLYKTEIGVGWCFQLMVKGLSQPKTIVAL